MKTVLFLSIILATWCVACHETTVGYLNVENASYDPDTMTIRKTPDPKLDAIRIKNKAPWLSLQLQGYEGTELIYFDVESVTSTAGEDAARVFMEELSIRGGGALLYPFKNNAVPGYYTVSVRLTNPGYSKVIKDAFTFVVKE